MLREAIYELILMVSMSLEMTVWSQRTKEELLKRETHPQV